jgi:hypothetical protein
MARVNAPGNIVMDYTNGVMTLKDGSDTLISTVPQSKAVGTFVANGATPVTVANANYSLGDDVAITLQVVGGTVSPTLPNVLTVTDGVGFTVGSTALDTSTYRYRIMKKT